MFAAERQKKIKEILLEYKQINVSSLSKLIGVTEATARKDLEVLEKEGFLEKTHGGATLIDNGSSFPVSVMSSQIDTDIYKVDKKKIAEVCCKIIKSGETVFLGAGSTCFHIAQAIRENTDFKNLVVITNSIGVMQVLYGLDNVNVITVGGQLMKGLPYPASYGKIAIAQLKELFVTRSFFAVDAVSTQHGYMLSSTESADFIEQLIKQSMESYVVADYSKFDKISLLKLCDLDGIRHIVTNENIPDSYKEYYYNNHIQLFTTAKV